MYFAVVATVTASEMTVRMYAGTAWRGENSIAANSKVAERAGLCLWKACLTMSAMPYLMAVLVI